MTCERTFSNFDLQDAENDDESPCLSFFHSLYSILLATMSFLRPVLPHLAQAVPSTSRATFVHFPVPSASLSRLFSSSSRAYSRPPPFNTPRPTSTNSNPSPFASLRNAFYSKRSIQTSPQVYAGQQATGQRIDWRKVGINVGFGVAGAVALNFALNRETRGPLAGFEGQYLVSHPLYCSARHTLTYPSIYSAIPLNGRQWVW